MHANGIMMFLPDSTQTQICRAVLFCIHLKRSKRW